MSNRALIIYLLSLAYVHEYTICLDLYQTLKSNIKTTIGLFLSFSFRFTPSLAILLWLAAPKKKQLDFTLFNLFLHLSWSFTVTYLECRAECELLLLN